MGSSWTSIDASSWRAAAPCRSGLREFAILIQLASQPGRVLTRQELLARAFQGQAATESAVNVRIRSLRHKLATAPPLDEQLITVYGVGYRWDAISAPARVLSDAAGS